MLKRGGESHTQLVLTLCRPHPNRLSFWVREDFRILQSCRVIIKSQRSARLPASRMCTLLFVQSRWTPQHPGPFIHLTLVFHFISLGKLGRQRVAEIHFLLFFFFSLRRHFFMMIFSYTTFKNRVYKVLSQTSNSRKLRKAILQNKQSTVKPNTRKSSLSWVKTIRRNRKCKNTKGQYESKQEQNHRNRMREEKQCKNR